MNNIINETDEKIKPQKSTTYLKNLIFPIIILIILYIALRYLMWEPETYVDDSTSITAIERQITDWREELNIIHSIDFPDGAVIFAVETIHESGNEYYMLNVFLYGKTSARFVDSHGYPITDLTAWSTWAIQDREMFESPESYLTLKSGWDVVYGVINTYLWNNSVSEDEKSKYNAVIFRHETIELVLYYRVIEEVN